MKNLATIAFIFALLLTFSLQVSLKVTQQKKKEQTDDEKIQVAVKLMSDFFKNSAEFGATFFSTLTKDVTASISLTDFMPALNKTGLFSNQNFNLTQFFNKHGDGVSLKECQNGFQNVFNTIAEQVTYKKISPLMLSSLTRFGEQFNLLVNINVQRYKNSIAIVYAQFDKADSNKNGFLSPDEFQARFKFDMNNQRTKIMENYIATKEKDKALTKLEVFRLFNLLVKYPSPTK
jgi:hypothetical protein